jgi:hypothetical protein
MVNIKFLDKINLATSPWAQKFVANAILAPNYHLFAKVKIKIKEKFKLFSKESQHAYKELFDAATEAIMKNIDLLLDDRYRLGA